MAADIQDLNPVFAEKIKRFLDAARAQGIDTGTISSGFRSIAEQTQLYNDLLAGRRRGPVAPPGGSMHNFGLATDISSPQIMALRRFASDHPEFSIYPLPGDTPHFQLAGNQRALMTNPPQGTMDPGIVAALQGGGGGGSIAPVPAASSSNIAAAPTNLTPGTTLNSMPAPSPSPMQQFASGDIGGALSNIAGNKDMMASIGQVLGGGDSKKPAPEPMQFPQLQDNSAQIAAAAPQLLAMLRRGGIPGMSLGGLYA